MVIMKRICRWITLLAAIWFGWKTAAAPIDTTFTYQGRLADDGLPANGSYDLRFQLFAQPTIGVGLGAPFTALAVPVTNGSFTLTLDFGVGVFVGEARWIEVAARTNGSGAYETLLPRQLLTAVPQAQYAPLAGSAISVASTNITGAIPDSSLSTNVALLTQSAWFTSNVTASTFFGSGSGLTNIFATHNVRRFGAKGNGIADDTDAIQAAVNAAGDAGGGVVYFPSGTYMVRLNSSNYYNGAIYLYTNRHNNVTLLGDGPDQTFIKMRTNGGFNVSVIHLSLVTNVTLRGLCIDGNQRGRGIVPLENEGVSVTGGSHLFFDNCRAVNTGADAFDIDDGKFVRFKDCVAEDAGAAGFGIFADYVSMTDCFATNCGFRVAAVEPDVAGFALGTGNYLTAQNIFAISNNLGIWCQAQRYTLIQNGVFDSARPDGTNALVAGGGFIRFNNCHFTGGPGISFKANLFSGGDGGEKHLVTACSFATKYGIIVEKAVELTIDGNIFESLFLNGAQQGIYVANAQNLTIRNNYFRTYLNGIYIGPGVANTVITDNRFILGFASSLSISGGGGHQIANNRFDDTYNTSISLGETAAAPNNWVSGNVLAGKLLVGSGRGSFLNNRIAGGIQLASVNCVSNLFHGNVVGGPGITVTSGANINNQVWFGNFSTNHTLFNP